MPSVTVYYTNRSAADLIGLLDLNESATSISRMSKVADLLGGPCQVLLDESGYTAYGQEPATNLPLNPVVKTPGGEPVYGNVLVIDLQA